MNGVRSSQFSKIQAVAGLHVGTIAIPVRLHKILQLVLGMNQNMLNPCIAVHSCLLSDPRLVRIHCLESLHPGGQVVLGLTRRSEI